MVCKNHIFPLSYVMIFIAFLVQVWRQRRGGGGGGPKILIFADRGGRGVQKSPKYTDVILEQPLTTESSQLCNVCSQVSEWIKVKKQCTAILKLVGVQLSWSNGCKQLFKELISITKTYFKVIICVLLFLILKYKYQKIKKIIWW